ncbi:MAG: hypothetical protein ACUVR8_08315 [Acidobacteriota bacterium]
MSSPPPLPPYSAPPPYGRVPFPKGGEQKLFFLVQFILGFLGTLAYGTIGFFLLLLTALGYGLPQIIPKLILFGGGILGVATVLFLTFYFRWWGVLAGAILACLFPVLLVGACAALVFGPNILGG